jgi:hypothetical protein
LVILGSALMCALPMKNLNGAKLGIATGAIVARAFFLLLPTGYAPLEFSGMREQITRFCLIIDFLGRRVREVTVNTDIGPE